MKTTALRLHGTDDLRLEEFELPPLKDDEILARVVSDSICMSSHKLAAQGNAHKRVRADLASSPVIVGHEFCGTIEKVGAAWAGKFQPGSKFAIQPALNYRGTLWAPGYSYPYIGGDATWIVIPREVMEMDCLLAYEGDAFFMGSLAEPVSCIVGAFRAQYHTEPGSYDHRMGIAEGGSLALLAGVGPMGLGAIDYALHADRRPSRMVVTDIDDARLARAAALYPPEEARRRGVELTYANTSGMEDPAARLRALNGGKGFDDVFVFAPVRQVAELGDALLGNDGCLNFFAGPTDPSFSATLNFYEVHYGGHHLVGTSGGNTDDIREALSLMAAGRLNPSAMITHVGGLDAAADATLRLPRISGGKKLIYTHKKLPLTALADFAARGAEDPFWAELSRLVEEGGGLWNREAEAYLLAEAPGI